MTITSNGWTRYSDTAGTWAHPHILALPDGSFLAIYTDAEGHYGRSATGCRRSTDGMVSWGAAVTAASDATYSITFQTPIILPSGRIVVWCMRREAELPLTNIDSGYVYSDDYGATWSAYQSRGGLLNAYAHASALPIKVGASYYVPSYGGDPMTSANPRIRLYRTTDGITIADTISPFPDQTVLDHNLNENAVAYLNGVWVVVARTNTVSEHGVHVTVSTDGTAWSAVQNIGLPDGWCSHPNVIAHRGYFYLVVGDREGLTGGYTAPFTDDKLWVYSSTPARLTANPSDWTLEASFARPFALSEYPSGTTDSSFYGYPQIRVVGNDMRVSVRESTALGGDPSSEYEYFTTLTGFPPTLTIGAPFTLTGDTITVTAPPSQRTSAAMQVYSASGGLVRVTNPRFDVSLTTSVGAQEVTVAAGSTQVFLGVTPQVGDSVITTSLEVAV